MTRRALYVCISSSVCLSLSVLVAHSTKHSVCFIRSDCLVCLEACQMRAGDNWGSEVDRKSGGLCCERKGRVQWEEGLRTEREEGVVLGLSVSGACGNAASLNCTVGLNLKYALLCCFSFLSTLFCLLLQGLNGFEYFWGWWVGECLPSGQNVKGFFLCVYVTGMSFWLWRNLLELTLTFDWQKGRLDYHSVSWVWKDSVQGGHLKNHL